LLKFKLGLYPELTWFAGCLYKGRNRGLDGALSRSSLKGVRIDGLRRPHVVKWTPLPAWPESLGLAGKVLIALLGLALELRGEADLSTKQNCAQAPARVSRPDGERGWPQSYRGAARARPQTAVRVKSFDDDRF
jgi:hypothetical protein